MSLSRRIAQQSIIQLAGKIAGLLLGLLTVGAMTRALGEEGFGYYSTIMGFLQFFGILVDFGLTLTTAQMLGEAKARGKAADWDEATLLANLLGLRSVSALVFLGMAPLIVLAFPYPAFVKVGIAIGSLSFFFASINQIFLGYFQAELDMRHVSLAEIGNRVFLFLAVIATIWLHAGLLWIIWAITVSNFVQFLMLIGPARRRIPVRLAFDRACITAICQRTWPIAFSIALNLLYLKTDIIVLSITRPPAEVGLYGAADKVVDVLTTFPVLFAGLILPLLTRFWQTNDRERFNNLIQQGFDAMALFALPLVVGTLFVGSDVMALVAGEAFRSSGLILQFMVWACAFIFLNAVFAHAIVAMNYQKETIFAYGITAVVGVIGCILLIPYFGAYGAAAMTTVSEGTVALLVFGTYVRRSGSLPSLRRWPSMILGCAGMGLFLFATTSWHFIPRFLLAIVIYAVLLLLSGGLSAKFIKELLTLRTSDDVT